MNQVAEVDVKALLEPLTKLVNCFSVLQESDGRVANRYLVIAEHIHAAITDAIADLRPPLNSLFDAAVGDLADWRHAGLDTPPVFDRSAQALGATPGEDLIAALAVARTPNSGRDGYKLELLVCRKHHSRLADAFRAASPIEPPSAVRIVAASLGFTTGECLVLFPENIKRSRALPLQPFAVFVVDRFAELYRRRALDCVHLVHPAWRVVITDQSDESLSEFRHVFTVIHDEEHKSGPRPLQSNLKLKSNHFCAVLDEARVDVRTLIRCANMSTDVGRVLAELIYLDRVIRLPRVPNGQNSADGAAGLLELAYLSARGVNLEMVDGCGSVMPALSRLLADIEAVERIPDDDDYRAAAEHLVRAYLPPGSPPNRHALPETLRGAHIGALESRVPKGYLTVTDKEAS